MGKIMKKSNNNLIRSIGFADDKGNSIELIRSNEERVKGFSQIVGAYCNLIRPAIVEGR